VKWLVLLAAVPSFLVALVAVPLVRKWAWRIDLVDRPKADRFHDRATPLGGGIAIWLAVISVLAAGTVAVRSPAVSAENSARGALADDHGVQRFVRTHAPGIRAQSGRLWTLLALATSMAALGLWDDLKRVDWRLRLGAQCLIAGCTVALGWRLSMFAQFPLLSGFLSVLWIIGVVNAFNLLDNMDGLSAGVALIASGLLALVMLTAPDPETQQPQLFVAGFLAVLVGALAGFLVYNWDRASIFMGDAGSYFVGYLVATSTLMATYAGGDLPRHAILAPLCVLAVPIYDTLSVVAIRVRERRSPFVGDKRHFSHRLVSLGLSPRQAVSTIYLLTLAAGLGALLLHQVDGVGAVVVGGMVICVLTVIAVLETAAQRSMTSSSRPSDSSSLPPPEWEMGPGSGEGREVGRQASGNTE
jgi:UDP-GlcNAc:undecaprenyl-phosphate GlcNAc-1-phosphate transferase